MIYCLKKFKFKGTFQQDFQPQGFFHQLNPLVRLTTEIKFIHSGTDSIDEKLEVLEMSLYPNQRSIGGKPPTFVQNDFTPCMMP